MSRILIGFISLLCILFPGWAEATDWKIDVENSHVGFEFTVQDKQVTGHFKHFNTKIHLDPDDLTTAHITASVDTSSATISDDQYKSAMLGKSGFDTANHTEAIFRSNSIEKSAGIYTAIGTLSLKGIEQAAVLTFNLKVQDGHAIASGDLTIIQSDYEIGSAGWPDVSPEVRVRISIQAHKID